MLLGSGHLLWSEDRLFGPRSHGYRPRPATNPSMARQGVDDDVIRTIREFGRPVVFGDIAGRLAASGISKSQVHNAVYRLGKRGTIEARGSRGAMTYVLPE